MKTFNYYSQLDIPVFSTTFGIYTKVKKWELKCYLYQKMDKVLYDKTISNEKKDKIVNQVLEAYVILSNEKMKQEYDKDLELMYLHAKEYFDTFFNVHMKFLSKIKGEKKTTLRTVDWKEWAYSNKCERCLMLSLEKHKDVEELIKENYYYKQLQITEKLSKGKN